MNTNESKVGETFVASIVAVAEGDAGINRLHVSADVYEDVLGLDCKNDYIWGVIKQDPLTIAITAQTTGAAAGNKLVGMLSDGTKFLGQAVTWHNRTAARPGRRLQCPVGGRAGAILPLADNATARVVSWNTDEVVVEFLNLASERPVEKCLPQSLFNLENEPLNINSKDDPMETWKAVGQKLKSGFSARKDNLENDVVLDQSTGGLVGVLTTVLTTKQKAALGDPSRVQLSFDGDWIVVKGTEVKPKGTGWHNYALSLEPTSGRWQFSASANFLPLPITKPFRRRAVLTEIDVAAQSFRFKLDPNFSSDRPVLGDTCVALEPVRGAVAGVKVAEPLPSLATSLTFKERLDFVKAEARWLIEQGVSFEQVGYELRAVL